MRLYAIARLMLGPTFRNIQASWVKEGLEQSQRLLSCGVNDLGGTLMNESISTTAGAAHGQLVSPARLRQVIRDAGRQPAQRTTTYTTLRTFPATLGEAEALLEAQEEPLNLISSPEKTFGSYSQWAQDESLHYQFERPKRAPLAERFQPATADTSDNLRADQDQTLSP
jgi:FO synthase subunit 2